MTEADESLAAGVRELIAEAEGADPGGLELAELPGGASRQVLSAQAKSGIGRWAIRRDPPGGGSFNPLEVEFRVVVAAREAGVLVPRAFGFELEGGLLGTAGYVMDWVDGTSVAPRILRRDEYEDARPKLAARLGEALARIHAMPGDCVEGVPRSDLDPAHAACELWESQLDEIGEPLPAVEAGLRWLRLNAPPAPEYEALVHGDFRLGNLIVDPGGLAAVIDWELCHSGDPAEDIGWVCIRSWRFGNDDMPVAGVGQLDELLSAYEAAGGTRPDPDRIRWWEAMGNVKWAVICARQAHDHLNGTRLSAELASLGRRICEPEWDLLELIGSPA